MSAGNISSVEKKFEDLQTPEVFKKKNDTTRVNINDLLARVREEQKKQNKVNFTFFGIFASLVIVVGIILSF